MILVRMRDEDCVNLSIRDWLKIRQRIFSEIFRVHPAIEHEPMARAFQIIRVRANLSMPRQIDEFQEVGALKG